jgi:plasmid stabilization system protein ParE
MSYKTVIVDEAKIDFRESFDWYKDINPKLAVQFKISFKQSLGIIKKNPLLFQIRYDDVRIILFETFPYSIHYTINKNLIVVKAIFHTSRDSKTNLF